MKKNKSGPLVTVDVEKLKWGLRSAFVGMALVVESIQLKNGGTAKPYDSPNKIPDPPLHPVADTSGADAATLTERNATIANMWTAFLFSTIRTCIRWSAGRTRWHTAGSCEGCVCGRSSRRT